MSHTNGEVTQKRIKTIISHAMENSKRVRIVLKKNMVDLVGYGQKMEPVEEAFIIVPNEFLIEESFTNRLLGNLDEIILVK